MSDWETYSPERFVGREKELQELRTWLSRTDIPRRVYSLVGAAGTGKTWLLHALDDQLQPTSQPIPNVISIWVKVPELIDTDNRISHARLQEWIDQIRKRLVKLDLPLPVIPSDVMEGRMVEILVDHLSNFGLRPVLLVEGYDEVNPKQAQIIGEDIIGIFLRNQQSRAIIATRDNKLNPLFIIRINQSPDPIHLVAQVPVAEQFTKFTLDFATKHQISTDDLPSIIQVLSYFDQITNQMDDEKKYQWNHYFINGFIFHTILDRAYRINKENISYPEKINIDDCKNCCRSLIERGRESITTSDIEKNYILPLQNIAHRMKKNWSQTELQEELNLNLQNIDHLFEYGTIYRHPQYRQRYFIAEGLYELLLMIPLPETQASTTA